MAWYCQTGSIRLRAFDGPVTALEGFEDGQWWVQDAAASLPAQLFGDLRGKTVVDLCAAPGGKTAQLIAGGAGVTALDQSASRLKRLATNLSRLGQEATLVETNMLDFKPDVLFDAALLDAPCSSTGTTRRHPDVLWSKTPEDIEKLAALQERMLRHALTRVRPGGLVVFSNCSLDPREGETMVARVLADTPDIVRVAISAADWPGLEEALTKDGEFRTTPAMLPRRSRSFRRPRWLLCGGAAAAGVTTSALSCSRERYRTHLELDRHAAHSRAPGGNQLD